MIYGVLYIDEGNFLNWHERQEEAEADVLEVVTADPAETNEFGYFAFDDDGHVVGEFVSGANVLAERDVGRAQLN